MKLSKLIDILESEYPPELAQQWDNVGLLIGDRRQDISNVLLTIDITPAVLKEAKRKKADMILSYHPVIWDGLKEVTADSQKSIVFDLIREGISVYSVHTVMDVIDGGVNDGLAEMVGISNPAPIGEFCEAGVERFYKLVVFIPPDSMDKVTAAAFKAGAGRLGNYSHCGFRSKGTGSFKPLQGSNPAVGERGRVEKVDEIRFECLVKESELEDVIDAVVEAHPYEQPAYDCFKEYLPAEKPGLGRMGRVGKPMKLSEILERIKKTTAAEAVGIIGDERKTVKKAAVCAGSCGDIINSVIKAGCDLYVTGELKHHTALAAEQAGLTCICLTHTVSERFILKKIAKNLRGKTEGISFKISTKDKDPFKWKQL